MPPSMQHMYQWEAPDGNHFIMDPLAPNAAAVGVPYGGVASAGGLVGMCVCVCVFVCACVRACVCVCINIYTYICIYIYI